jgi:hypothetical protein
MKTDQRMAVELAIAAKGKRKERATKIINGLKGLLAEELEGHPDLIKAVAVIEGYRKALDEEV